VIVAQRVSTSGSRPDIVSTRDGSSDGRHHELMADNETYREIVPPADGG